jgi:hypothetical protein
VNRASLAILERWTAAIVLIGGLGLTALQAAVRFALLWRPIVPPDMTAAGGGIGSVSVGGIAEDIVYFVPAALAAAWCLARAPRRRRWWAPGYLAVVAIYITARLVEGFSRGDAMMRALQEQGPEYLMRPRTPGTGDIVWVVVDAALFASLFVAVWLRLQPARPAPSPPGAP